MRLFRSGEHVGDRDPRGVIALPTLVHLFSAPMFQRRADPDYASRLPEYLAQLIPTLDDLDAGSHFKMSWLEKKGFAVAQMLGL